MVEGTDCSGDCWFPGRNEKNEKYKNSFVPTVENHWIIQSIVMVGNVRRSKQIRTAKTYGRYQRICDWIKNSRGVISTVAIDTS